MRIVRFQNGPRESWGWLESDKVIRELESRPFDGIRPGTRTHDAAAVRLLPPARPGKIIALGLNYRDHARELGLTVPSEPILFLKSPSAVIGPGETIVLPPGAGRVDYEAELALVIGKRSKGLTPGEALGAVLGVTCLNDVTARDLQKKDGQWTRSKSFDTFAPLGPWIETEDVGVPRDVECRVNGRLRQRGSTNDFIFDLPAILAFISGIMTLEPGDVIATGTPAGIGPLAGGDIVEVGISGIGTLQNRVA